MSNTPNRTTPALISVIFFLLVFSLPALSIENSEFWTGNQIGNWWNNEGTLSTHRATGGPGLEWPLGESTHVVFASGLWVLAGQVDGEVDVRSAATEFSTEYVPGPWGSDPEDLDNRIYKIVTAEGSNNPDWDLWPVDQGAPWIDVDEDGSYNPDVDEPDVKGDEYWWTIFNDGDESRHSNLWSTAPLDIEVEVELYGFGNPHPLENTLFYEITIQNAGTHQLDSVFVGIWEDLDMGRPQEQVGCSPELDMFYHYKSVLPDEYFGYTPPAAGYLILQGPVVQSPGDTAWVDGEALPDYRNQGMSSYTGFTVDQTFQDPENAIEAYNFLNGIDVFGNFITNPITAAPDPFSFNGDPLTQTGWLSTDLSSDRDWRGVMGSGPFSLAPGEEQHIVVGFLVSRGSDNWGSLAALWEEAELLHDVFDQQFQNLDQLTQISESNVPHNTESSGPLDVEFEIMDPSGDWQSPVTMYCQVNGSDFQVSLTNTAGDLWSGQIPNIGATSTTRLDYHLYQGSIFEQDPHWPPGAPYNQRQLILGPDLQAPLLAGLDQHYDVHYLLLFDKPVRIDTVHDDRFGIDEIWLNWTIGSSDIMTAPMSIMDSNEVYWEPNYVYETLLSDQASTPGDTIHYWVSATDGSQAGNLGESEHLYFVATEQEDIGDWDNAPDYYSIRDWIPFSQGSLVPFNDGVHNWGMTINEQLTDGDAHDDTMSMTRSLDLSAFDQGWLNIPMATIFTDSANYGLVQFKLDGNWQTVDSLVLTTQPAVFSYDLRDYLSDSFALRFIIHREDRTAYWIIDDVLLHQDPDLLSNDPGEVLALRFELQQNYPNPFNPETTIRYSLPVASDLGFVIYDVLGRRVREISIVGQAPGWHSLNWDGCDAAGRQLPTGIYIGHLAAGEYGQSIKMLILR